MATHFPFIRTRSMTQRLESLSQNQPTKPASGQGLVPPTASTRIPLSEALLNLERDGSPRKSRSLSEMQNSSFKIAPLKLTPTTSPVKPEPSPEDKENPFLATSLPSSPIDMTKKRKMDADDYIRSQSEDSPKRHKVDDLVLSSPAESDRSISSAANGDSDEGLGTVQRKISFLSLKRARDSSPPAPEVNAPDTARLTVPDPDIDDVSPRKRQRPTFLGADPSNTRTASGKPDLPEMPHINLAKPPPSPTRLRQPSPTKFTGFPQLQKKDGISRSPGTGSLFAMSIGDKLKKDGAASKEPAPSFMSKLQSTLPEVGFGRSPKSSSTPISTVPDALIDPALLDQPSPPSTLPSPDGQAAAASPPRQSTTTAAPIPMPTVTEVAVSTPPTPLRALSPPGRLPSSRLPVRSSRLRGQPSLASLAMGVAQMASPSPMPQTQPQPQVQSHPQPTRQPPPQRHPMQTRAGNSRPIRAVRKQPPPSAFRAPPRSTTPAPEVQEDILAPIKDHDHVSRDVGTTGAPARAGLTSLSSEAQTSLSNLSTALSKLSAPPPRSNSRLGFSSSSRPDTEKSGPAPATKPAGTAPRRGHTRSHSQPTNGPSIPTSKRTSSISALASIGVAVPTAPSASSDLGASAGPAPCHVAPLTGCVVFVDVRTKDGDDAGGVFVEMLKALGARVLKSPSPSLTHLVLKSPLPQTITRYHNLPDPKPDPVAVGWVVKCAEENRRVEVAQWTLDLSAGAGIVSAIPGCSTRPNARPYANKGGPRRPSMEPRRVELLDEMSLGHIAVPMEDRVERAKRRSLMYQPKYSSPLRTNAFIPNKGDDEDMDVDGEQL